jgi:hypothetical protein
MGSNLGSPSTMASSPTASLTPTVCPKFCRLSPEELGEKRKKGECYFYPKKFTQDHNCPMKRVFMMEFDDQEDPDVVADGLGISLHALTGLSGTNNMQLMLSIAGTSLHALVDSESTHTFIHDVVVHVWAWRSRTSLESRLKSPIWNACRVTMHVKARCCPSKVRHFRSIVIHYPLKALTSFSVSSDRNHYDRLFGTSRLSPWCSSTTADQCSSLAVAVKPLACVPSNLRITY